MSTTISKLATLVLRAIGGGVITDDLQPKRPTVEYYVSIALKYVFIENYRRNRREELSDPTSNDSTAFTDRQFLTTYTVTVKREFDDVFAELPVRPLAIPGNRWLDRVFVNRNESFVLVRTPDTVRSLSGSEMGGNTVCYPEDNKVFFINLSPLTGEVKVVMAPDPLGAGADVALNLPSGVEVQVVNLARDFFTKAKAVPQDLLNDNTIQ